MRIEHDGHDRDLVERNEVRPNKQDEIRLVSDVNDADGDLLPR